MSTENITDQATATTSLSRAREDLVIAKHGASERMAELQGAVVRARPQGVLTVAEIAEAIGRDRNVVDTWFSHAGWTEKGKQVRVSVDATPDERDRAKHELKQLAEKQRNAAAYEATARSERDRVVAFVYASRILGPSAIASAVGMDRNHVLRICRKAGVRPVWRKDGQVRNQYTASH